MNEYFNQNTLLIITVAPLLLGVTVFFIKRFITKTDEKLKQLEDKQNEVIIQNVTNKSEINTKLDLIRSDVKTSSEQVSKKIEQINRCIENHEVKMFSHEQEMQNTMKSIRSESKEVLTVIKSYSETLTNVDKIIDASQKNFGTTLKLYEELNSKISKLEITIKKNKNNTNTNTESLNKVSNILKRYANEVKKLKEYRDLLINKSKDENKNNKNSMQNFSTGTKLKTEERKQKSRAGEQPKILKTLFKKRDK